MHTPVQKSGVSKIFYKHKHTERDVRIHTHACAFHIKRYTKKHFISNLLQLDFLKLK